MDDFLLPQSDEYADNEEEYKMYKKPMKQVVYVEGKMEYDENNNPQWVEKEYPAMLEGIQGDGSAIVYIDTIPYRVPVKRLKGI